MRKLVVILSGLLVFVCAGGSAGAGQLSDRDLAERVADSVRGYPQLGIFDDVTVSVIDEAVTLTGRVTMPFKRTEVGARVAKVAGVRGVTNDIQVLRVSGADSALRVQIAQAIYGHAAFRQYAAMGYPPIHILVENGQVTLVGHVSSQVERALAGALARVPSAFGVVNELTVGK